MKSNKLEENLLEEKNIKQKSGKKNNKKNISAKSVTNTKNRTKAKNISKKSKGKSNPNLRTTTNKQKIKSNANVNNNRNNKKSNLTREQLHHQNEIKESVSTLYNKSPQKKKKKSNNIKYNLLKSLASIFLIIFFGILVYNYYCNTKKLDNRKTKDKEIKKIIKEEKPKRKSILSVLGENHTLSDFYLDLYTLDGSKDVTHPKVISFKQPWNGYKYWIAYTPYLNGDQSKENPYVLVSNDLVKWEHIIGYENPLDVPEDDDFKKVYNSDTHLVYNNDMDVLECYWRYVNDKENDVKIYKRTTTDGVNWTDKEVVLEGKRKDIDYYSPAIMYDKQKYKVWYVDRDRKVKYIEYDIKDRNWSEPVEVKIEYDEELYSWHLDVIKTEKGYEAIIVAFDKWSNRAKMKLYYSFSKDNITWETAKPILEPPLNGGLYRSTFLYLNDTYYVFYSVITKNFNRGVSIAYGDDIYNLNGLKNEDTEKFIEYIKENG